MTAGAVRVLRVGPKPLLADIDAVTNPALLAHRLMQLDRRIEDKGYSRRLRLSSIADVCVRERLLGLRGNISYRSCVDIGLRVTFDIGNALHEFFQNDSGYFGGNLLGWWRCSACGQKVFGRRKVDNCRCGALPGASKYMEHMLRLPEDIPVAGHPDAFLEVAPGDIRIADFKSINGEEFAGLTSATAAHAMQVTGYMEYIAQDRSLPVQVNRDKGFVIYVSKKHMTRELPFKAFHIERNHVFLEHIREKVAMFKRGLDDEAFLPGTLPLCSAGEFQRSPARICPVVDLCRELAGA